MDAVYVGDTVKHSNESLVKVRLYANCAENRLTDTAGTVNVKPELVQTRDNSLCQGLIDAGLHNDNHVVTVLGGVTTSHRAALPVPLQGELLSEVSPPYFRISRKVLCRVLL